MSSVNGEIRGFGEGQLTTKHSEPVDVGRDADADIVTQGPLGDAIRAHARGDMFLQLELAVTSPRHRSADKPDVLGQVEAIGWSLAHAGYVFVQTGSTSTSPIMSSGQGTVVNGEVVGIYLFRRASS